MDNIHDKYFMENLSDKDNAIAFLNVTLPADVSDLLDMSTLTSVKDSFITPDLEELFADIVFDCKLSTGEEVYCSILIEHKSSKDPFVAFQLGNYIFAAYHAQIKTKRPLKVIIPLLFYHHQQEWKFKPVESFFNGFPTELQRFIPKFDTVFFDVKRMDDDKIMNIQNLAIASFLLSQKHIYNLEFLIEKIVKITESLQNYEDRNSLLVTFVYLKLEITKAEAKQKNIINNPLNKKFMAIVEETFTEMKKRWETEIIAKGIAKGILKGKAEGKAEGMEEVVIKGYKKGLDIAMLANITQLTEGYVLQILKKYNLL